MRGAVTVPFGVVASLGAVALLGACSACIGSGRGARGASLLRTRTGNVELLPRALAPAQPAAQARAMNATNDSARSWVMAEAI
jgi:hypothetical protein